MSEKHTLSPVQRTAVAICDLMAVLTVLDIIETESFREDNPSWADEKSWDDLKEQVECLSDEVNWRTRKAQEALTDVVLNLRMAVDEMKEARRDG